MRELASVRIPVENAVFCHKRDTCTAHSVTAVLVFTACASDFYYTMQ